MMDIAEESLCFHYELGLAFTLWSRVENTILQVLFTTFPTKSHFKVGVGFLSIENFRSKLAFADSIMHEAKLSKLRLKQWDKISQRLGSASVVRNRLAHGRVYIYPNEAPGRRMALDSWKLMKTPATNTRPSPGTALCVRDIVGIKYDFFALVATMENYSSRLGGAKAPLPASLEQRAPVPSLQTIRTQIRAALPSLTPPSKASRLAEALRARA